VIRGCGWIWDGPLLAGSQARLASTALAAMTPSTPQMIASPTPQKALSSSPYLTRYCGVLSSHASLRRQVVPAHSLPPSPTADARKPAGKSRHIPWAELLRRTFAIDIKPPTVRGRLVQCDVEAQRGRVFAANPAHVLPEQVALEVDDGARN